MPHVRKIWLYRTRRARDRDGATARRRTGWGSPLFADRPRDPVAVVALYGMASMAYEAYDQ